MPDQPNVLFLMADQWNARCFGFEGHPDVKTPNLDQLAASGVRFTRAYAQNPICTPSRMCYLTGQYAHNTGYYGLSGPNPDWLPHAFAHFRAHGYVTGAVGKIHTPTGWIEPSCDYFREAYAYGMGLSGSHYEEFLRGAGQEDDRDDDTMQEWAEIGGGGQGLDARPSRLPYELCVDRWTASHAQNFLRVRPSDRPFFLWVSFPRPHETYLPSQEFWDLYGEDRLTLPPNANDPMTDKPPHARRHALQQRETNRLWVFEPRDWEHGRRRVLRGYYGCCTQVDHAVGEVLATLDELGLRDDTLIVFCADHGDFAGEHGIIEKAPGVAYEAITRVPYIWSWGKRFPAGQSCESLVESVDFFATVCHLAGLLPPVMCDGLDLSRLLGGEHVLLREAAFTETPWTKRIRTERWSFVHYQPAMFPEAEDVGELYDLEADPWELTNLYHDLAYQEVVQSLRRQVAEWVIGTSHPTTVLPMPAHLTNPVGVGPTPPLPEDRRIPPSCLIDQVREGRSRNYL